MCGRFTLHAPAEKVADLFGLDCTPDLPPRYNIAPTQLIAAVRAVEPGKRELVQLRWGLVPSWATDLSIGNRLLNARAETVSQKPAFRTAFRRRRCLILADGFYEWLSVSGKKQPLHVRFLDGRIFALAGLWERWLTVAGPSLETCTILTTEANEVVKVAHERMPVILAQGDFALWLDPTTKGEPVQALLRPWRADEMTSVHANPSVNNARNEGPVCLARQPDLFASA